MLSATIQSSVNPKAIGSAAVTANAGVESAGVNPEQGKNFSAKNSAVDVQGNLFSGQLNKALNEAANAEFSANQVTEDQSLTEVLNSESLEQQVADQQSPNQQAAEQDSNQHNRDQQTQPDAEQWLQTMLGQQQLQLQTRDSADATNAEKPSVIANTSTPISGALAITATAQQPVDKASVTQQASSTGTASVNASSASARISNPVTEKSFESFAKSTLNANQALFATQADSVAPAPTALNGRVLANPSLAVNSSAANLSQLPSAVLTETGATESVSLTATPSALTANGTESTQRVQSQLTLHAPEAKWGEQLLHALRDNVQVQIQQKIQNATIRLDPPELGSLEIYLSHESGRLTVQITSSQADVARLIQATSERLRQELSGPQFTQVNVQTFADGQSGQQQSRERQRFMSDEMILANEQEFITSDPAAKRSSDVLVTV
jgi:flagellar hook-length control protein FliK